MAEVSEFGVRQEAKVTKTEKLIKLRAALAYKKTQIKHLELKLDVAKHEQCAIEITSEHVEKFDTDLPDEIKDILEQTVGLKKR